ncbi:hypothetical protein CCYA_CCYA08G2431 [Cyanidiococcus yangmingshanensis]|nr:hypothetical protein CCYA_CCYA08G2431 [Cyanidiococcus yangmingshanensis]
MSLVSPAVSRWGAVAEAPPEQEASQIDRQPEVEASERAAQPAQQWVNVGTPSRVPYTRLGPLLNTETQFVASSSVASDDLSTRRLSSMVADADPVQGSSERAPVSRTSTNRNSAWRRSWSRMTRRVLSYGGKKLELASFLNALLFLGLLMNLHLTYVNRPGCALTLMERMAAHHQEALHDPALVLRQYDLVEVRVVPSPQDWRGDQGPWSRIQPLWDRLLPRSQRYQFATEKGFLLLSEQARLRHNISELHLELATADACFGSSRFMRGILKYIVGSETVVLNAFAYLLQYGLRHGQPNGQHSLGTDGYVMNLQSGDIYNIGRVFIGELYARSAYFTDVFLLKTGVLLTSVYVMFTIGALIAFALREVQTRIMKLALEIQNARNRTPYAGALFSSSIHALVLVPIITGILFFLFEFFDNQLLAFCVLVVAWIAEVTVMLGWRSGLSVYILPRAFAAYLLAFHIYFFSFPLGFSWLALFTCAAFMQHTVFLVFSRFETPRWRVDASTR